MRHAHAVSLALMVAGLAACGGSLDKGEGRGGAGGGGGQITSGGAGIVGGGGAAGAAGGGGGVVGPPYGNPRGCVPGVPWTSQLRRMPNRSYDAVVRDLLGLTALDLGGGARPPSALLYQDFDGPMPLDAWRLYKDVGKAIAKAVMANPTQKVMFIGCDPAAGGCLETTIKSFGRKAFRRPLTTAEVTRFMAIGQPPSQLTPADAAEATLYAFLISPSFLMLPELDTTPAGTAQTFKLSSYEVATRLSFLLWGSVGDDQLNAAADANQLQTKEQILSQAKRMLAVRDKAAPQVAAFHRHWLQMDSSNAHWWNGEHDSAKFPLYSAAAKKSFAAELDSFFAEVAYTGGSFKDLFLSNVAFVNKDNAWIYGLGESGTALTKVFLDPVQRPGFLTRAGFLSSYAHYDSTAPMLRGAFITIWLIGVDPGPSLPGATMIQAPAGQYLTVRERTEALVNQSTNCMGCHSAVINPPGFVLENYDAVGAWQTIDQLGLGTINPVATVNFGDGIRKEITNAQELMQQIAATKKARYLYAQSMVAYAYGREPNPPDDCVLDAVGASLAVDGYGILDLFADLTQPDSFRLRVRGQ